ncbi:hypothetical protein TNCV_4077091 [Trichonephila clavipes]|nr:hypothetical protein TNCV_4077091 [Trichonephila clavipes]
MFDESFFQKLLHESNKKQPPVHEWYEGNHPGAALLGTGRRRDETTLARFHSGHTRAQRLMMGLKVYPSCPNCSVTQAAPAPLPHGLYWLP